MRKVALSLLFLACCVPLLGAQPPEKVPVRDELVLKKLQEIDKTLEDIKTSLAKDVDDIKKNSVTISGEEWQKLTKSIERLNAETAQLKASQVKDAGERIGVPLNKGAANPPDATQYAKIKIINDYPTEQTVIVNKETYKVESGQTKIIDLVMPGTFTFKVVGIQDTEQTRTINPNQVYTITIYPQK